MSKRDDRMTHAALQTAQTVSTIADVATRTVVTLAAAIQKAHKWDVEVASPAIRFTADVCQPYAMSALRGVAIGFIGLVVFIVVTADTWLYPEQWAPKAIATVSETVTDQITIMEVYARKHLISDCQAWGTKALRAARVQLGLEESPETLALLAELEPLL